MVAKKAKKGKKIALIEDHHEAYFKWRKNNFKNLTLVHFDAHLDFFFPKVKNQNLIFQEAKSVAELRSQLEKALLFSQKKIAEEKLINIGNYIYSAMRDGIVADFFWVIPGSNAEFQKCLPLIEKILKNLTKKDPRSLSFRATEGSRGIPFQKGKGSLRSSPRRVGRDDIVKTKLYGNNFTICNIDSLPKINQQILLDIDIDFLTTDSIRFADNTKKIGKRKIWITPENLVSKIKRKIKKPIYTTLSYSTNGGWTPLKFKYLGDQIKDILLNNKIHLPLAAENFSLFNLYYEKKNFRLAKKYYDLTIKFDKTYNCADNNYGPLFLAKKKYQKARKEFTKILTVDEKNPFGLAGMGELNLALKKYKDAKIFFEKALKFAPKLSQAGFGLGQANFYLNNFKTAKKLILKYQKTEPMRWKSHFFLARIYQKENKIELARKELQNARQLGWKEKKK